LDNNENRSKKLLFIISSIVSVLVLIVIVITYQYSEKQEQLKIENQKKQQTENKYTAFNGAIEQKAWDEAIKIAKEIPDYKDVAVLKKVAVKKRKYEYIAQLIKDRKYDDALSLCYTIEPDKCKKEDDGGYDQIDKDEIVLILKKYVEALKFAQEGKTELEIAKYVRIPDNYVGPLSEQINRDKYASITELLKNNEYEKALEVLRRKGVFYGHSNCSKTYESLLYYLMYLKPPIMENKYYYLRQIPSDYDGPVKEEIKIALNNNSLEMQRNKKREDQEKELLNVKPKTKPRIGMVKEEVLNSLWGKPQDINKTITEYGTHEQWVYDIDRYVYFDDVIVTGIQE